MSCFFCKGKLIESTAPHMIELTNCVLIVKNVPCRRCTQCGEVFFSSDVSEQLDSLAGLYEDTKAEIAVVNYAQKSA